VTDVDDEIVREFLDESRDNLDQLDRDLVALETRPTDPDLLAQVFRTIHTIKGTCGFLGYHNLEGLTHAGENLLSALRDGDLVLNEAITTSLLHLVDVIRGVLARIAETGADGGDDHGMLAAAISRHLATAAPKRAEAVVAPAARSVTAPADATVRVDVAVLDKLMDLAGELVRARTQIGELADEEDENPLTEPYQLLRLVTNELRDAIVRARLQPIGNATNKSRRVVRDLAADLGKQVRVELEGEDVAVDKAVNEVLRDPLLHLVRNAVDHGIEMPDARLAAGKPAEGVIAIRASHEGGRVLVELSDDGDGIDVDGLVRRAVESGSLSAAAAASLPADEAYNLMFRAGLSTKAGITAVSGRGVGMDVVQAGLQQVGGTIHVTSERGRGTRMRISLPLTLATMPTLIVRSGGSRYLIPQADILELVPLEHGTTATSFTWRDRLLSLVHLADRLGHPPGTDGPRRWIVVLLVDGQRFGVAVDAIDDTAELIIKPLPAALRSITAFAGVAILGDGQPALVLDAADLAETVEITADASTEDRVVDDVAEATLLIVHDAAGGRFAIPLATVRRVEHLEAASIDRTGVMAVADHLGDELPLIDLAGPVARAALPVVVCSSSAGHIGLVIHRIGDVAASVTEDVPRARLIDVEQLVATAGLGQTA
jgi:two-component system, chemotaxis family, sensor kinase CheA